jgi:hypothetical protein
MAPESSALQSFDKLAQRRLFASTISMRPDDAGAAGRTSGITTAGTKPASEG